MTYDDALKTPAMAVERRQLKLAKNNETRERLLRKLFRVVTALKKNEDERKRLLNPRKRDDKSKDLDWTKDKFIGSGGGDPDLDDSLEGI